MSNAPTPPELTPFDPAKPDPRLREEFEKVWAAHKEEAYQTWLRRVHMMSWLMHVGGGHPLVDVLRKLPAEHMSRVQMDGKPLPPTPIKDMLFWAPFTGVPGVSVG